MVHMYFLFFSFVFVRQLLSFSLPSQMQQFCFFSSRSLSFFCDTQKFFDTHISSIFVVHHFAIDENCKCSSSKSFLTSTKTISVFNTTTCLNLHQEPSRFWLLVSWSSWLLLSSPPKTQSSQLFRIASLRLLTFFVILNSLLYLNNNKTSSLHQSTVPAKTTVKEIVSPSVVRPVLLMISLFPVVKICVTLQGLSVLVCFVTLIQKQDKWHKMLAVLQDLIRLANCQRIVAVLLVLVEHVRIISRKILIKMLVVVIYLLQEFFLLWIQLLWKILVIVVEEFFRIILVDFLFLRINNMF